MDLRTRNSRNLNLLQVFHELLYNAGYRDSRVLFAIHRFYPSPLQSFIRSRNVIRTPSPPNLSQKLLLLVMKLTVDCHASSLPWKGRTWTVVINFSTTLLDKRDFNTELQTLHPFILHLRDPCYLTSEENYTRFLFLRSFQRVCYCFFLPPTDARKNENGEKKEEGKKEKNSKYIKIRWKKLFRVKGISRSSWLDRKCTKTFYTSVVSLGKVTFYLRAFFFFLSFVSLRKAQKNILEKIEKRVKFRDDTSIQVDENLYIYIINSEGNKEKFMVNYETLALRIGG